MIRAFRAYFPKELMKENLVNTKISTGERISKTILEVALEENRVLTGCFNKGIFDIPELAFVYLVGKKISFSTSTHFDSENYSWVREKDFGNGGPTDLAFISSDINEPNYLIEFKMDDTYHSYNADIEKLKEPLNTEHRNIHFEKFFCGLKWVENKEQGEKWLETLRNLIEGSANLVLEYVFPTIVGDPKIKRFCLYTFWQITN